jgi:EmrB/QacA subfamily drug resistance transporter
MGLDRRTWTVAAVVIVGAIMSILDTTIVNVALETLSRDLSSPLQHIQWIVTGYLLALAMVIPLTGWASERFGARRVWMTTVAVFVASSALCGAAWNVPSLIFFRVIQGFGGGMIMPVGIIVLTLTAGPQRVGRVMGIIGVPMLLAPVLGPVIGGFIVQHASWRWIFYINLPIGILGLVLAWRILPATRGGECDPLDWRGVALISPGLGLLTFGLSEVPSHGGVTDSAVYLPAVAGLALVVSFVVHALRARSPLIDVRLFRNGRLRAAGLTTFFLGVALFGALILLPLYYQVVRGETAFSTGLLLAPQGLGAAFAMPISGRLTDRVGGGSVAVCGIVVLSAATLAFTQLSATTSYAFLVVVLFIRGIGLGFSMMPAMASAYATMEPANVPRATSALNVLQRVGGSFGTALMAVILQHQITTSVPGGAGAGLAGGPAVAGPIPHAVATPLAGAFGHTFWWAFALTAAALVPASVLAVRERRHDRLDREQRLGAQAAAMGEEIPDPEREIVGAGAQR